MKNNEMVKHQAVREALTDAIRRGEYQPGARLPAERDIAQLYGVSYMTARRAVTEMVEMDLLRRRAREGTFVRAHSSRRLATKTLHLVCPAFDSSSIRAFLRLGAQAAEGCGWRADVIRLHREQVRPAVRAIEGGDLVIVLPEGPELHSTLGEAMQKAKGRAVLLGNRLDDLGVPSVLADDAQGIRLAMECLKAAGHSEIAVVSGDPQHSITRVQLAAWQASLHSSWDESRIGKRRIVVNTPRHEDQSEHTYAAITKYLAEDDGQTTAMLCLLDEMTLPSLSACRAMGRAVPEKMSLIASGNSPDMAFTHPPMTCVDVQMAEHINMAMDILNATLEDRLPLDHSLRLVQPHIVLRESVRPLPNT